MPLQQTNTVYVALDLIAWHQQGGLVLSPKFQRRGVWSLGAKSYFIDTMLRGFPVPPIHLRTIVDPTRGVVREVIDGQQRLRALLDFIEGKYRLGRQLDAPWAGKSYSDLPADSIERLMEFKFQTYQYQNVTDVEVLEIFQRINTYSVALNAQELRHGRYFGQFRQSVYALSHQHLAFWRDTRMFSESSIARMGEAQLVSELLILQMDGLQDKKSSINEFYARLDEAWGSESIAWQSNPSRRATPVEWLSRKECEKRFMRTLDEVSTSVGSLISETAFRRVPLFYSLYSAVYHRLYGLPGFEASTPRKPLGSATRTRLAETMTDLSDVMSSGTSADNLSGWRRDFVMASSRQTDNLGPRLGRLAVIWKRAEMGS